MRREALLLDEIISAAQRAIDIAMRHAVEDLDTSPDARDALLWNLTVIGEAVNQLPDDLRPAPASSVEPAGPAAQPHRPQLLVCGPRCHPCRCRARPTGLRRTNPLHHRGDTRLDVLSWRPSVGRASCRDASFNAWRKAPGLLENQQAR